MAKDPSFEPQTVDGAISIGYGLAIGDMDGDGKQDILLADAKEFVWYKNPTWEKQVFAKLPGIRDNVCIAAEDIDGDGKNDFIVGAPFANKKAGAISVWLGKGNTTELGQGWAVPGTQAGGLMGASLAVVSDLNSDGSDEVLVGSPGMNSSAGKAAGLAQLLSGADGEEVWSMTGKAAKSNFGSSVASADINDDGKADMVVGARMSDAAGGTMGKPKAVKGAGSVSVFNGAAAAF